MKFKVDEISSVISSEIEKYRNEVDVDLGFWSVVSRALHGSPA